MEPSTQEDVLCQTCGDKGITNAFVYCGKCLQAVVHRYCLLVMPKTLDECVIWHCEDCKAEVLQSKKADDVKSSHVTRPKKKLKKKKNISSLISRTKQVTRKEYITEPEGGFNNKRKSVFPCHIPKKQRTKRPKFSNRLNPDTMEDNNIQNGLKTGVEVSVKYSSDAIDLVKSYLNIKKDVVDVTNDQIDGFSPSKPSCKHENLKSDSPNMEKEPEKEQEPEKEKESEKEQEPEKEKEPEKEREKEPEKATFDECKNEAATNVSQSEFSDMGEHYRYVPAYPVMDPIWRGDIAVLGTINDLFKGLVAHFSNKACHQVIQEAKTLPTSLHLEMHPTNNIWPKSFKDCPPSDDKIALYFFPEDPINEKAYDRLVLKMMDNELAMKTSTTNAELLIFTSIYLPPLFWRIQGKYYLWGVFRGKLSDHTSQDSSIEVKKMLNRVKNLDGYSPRSPLSSNGDNGGDDMDPESGD